jgi:NAD(P)-dependent dehydrogenase (short-subunit alcohol dehydrogenase family)
MDLELREKRAIVTGGSRGIGKAIARQLAEEGADVVIAARTREPLIAAARELSTVTGRRVLPAVTNTADRHSVESLVAFTVAELGGVDILVNNAAIPGGSSAASRLEDIQDEHVLEDINVKVVGYLRTARAAAPYLIKAGGGRIINIGGLAAYKSGRLIATLRNIGVTALTKSLADELGHRGVGVFAVHPGATRTERTDAAAAASLGAANGLGRIVDAKEIAALVAFLASPKSALLQGDSLLAGGGTPGPIRY